MKTLVISAAAAILLVLVILAFTDGKTIDHESVNSVLLERRLPFTH